MRSIRLAILILFSNLSVTAQVIPLDSCIEWAYQKQRFSDQELLINQSREVAMESAGKINLPTLILDGSATYQNENITIETPPVPGFTSPNVPLNFNRLLVNFNQTIYNGRLAAHKKHIDSLSYDTKAVELSVDKAKIKSAITGLYSSIILTRQQQAIINKQMGTLDAMARQLQGSISAGVAYRSDLLNLQAETLKLKQNATELEYLESSLRKQLSVFTAYEIQRADSLVLPQVEIERTGVEARPELQLISQQMNVLQAQSDLSLASRMPYIGVFGSAGLGYPGYDIFNSSVRPMAIIGLKLNWHIYDWNKSKNDRQLLTWNSNLLAIRYDRVRDQFEAELVKQEQEIFKMEELISRDKEIVKLRQEVTQETSSRLSGGTATSTDFIIQVNNEAVAELNQSIHILKLALAKLNYEIIQGK